MTTNCSSEKKGLGCQTRQNSEAENCTAASTNEPSITGCTYCLTSQTNEVYQCPECGYELHEVLTDTFVYSTDETLQVLEQLDEEATGG